MHQHATVAHVSRLTITLPEDLHRALKEAAARRGVGMSEIIGESLRLYGIKPREAAEALVARARAASRMTDEAALELAAEETRKARARAR